MLSLRSLIILHIALPIIADAQPKPDSLKPSFTVGTTQTALGYLRFNFPELNARFTAAGLPKVATSTPTIGLGADIRTGGALVGASFQTLLGRDRRDAGYRTRISGSYSFVDVGYAALHAKRTFIYPIVGVGLTQLSINVKQRGDFGFDDGLETPRREIAMSGAAAVGHAGVLVEQRFQRNGSDFAVSVRFGTTRTLGSLAWTSDDSRVNDGPNQVRGSYVRFAFSKPLRTRRDATLPIAGTIAQAMIR